DILDAMQRIRGAVALAVLGLGALTLAGCAGSIGGFSDLDADREAQDELPALDEVALASVDAQTSRYVGEYKGTWLWLVEGRADSPVCLVAASDDSEWTMACGSGAGLTTSGALGRFTVVPDNLPAPHDATAISENV